MATKRKFQKRRGRQGTAQREGADPTPKYFQILREFERRMLGGELPVGSQVPTEFAVCEEFGVSRITARKALNLLREDGVVDRTRGRGSFVVRLPEPHADGEAPVRASEIGVLTSYTPSSLMSPLDDWGIQILRRMDSLLATEGYHITMLPGPAEPGRPISALTARMDEIGRRLAGVLCFSTINSDLLVAELDRRNLPWVTINPLERRQTHNFVSADNHGGGRAVGGLFAVRGFSPVLMIGPPLGSAAVSNGDKFFGFTEGFISGGGAMDCVDYFSTRTTKMAPEEAAALREIFLGPKRPRGIFCFGDILASDVLRVCHASGLNVPNDVAVVGGTGLMIAEHTTPTLTVLAQPMQKMGEEAEKMLVEMIRTGQRRVPGVFVESQLIFRESCPAEG